MSKFIVTFILLLSSIHAQNLLLNSSETIDKSVKSPKDFLSYSLGTYFTQHHKILEYLDYLHKQKPGNTVFSEYGKTYEGRPLTTLIISSTENIKNLEDIFSKNRELTENPSRDIKVPSIIWLAYGVHGNESSAAESAMLTAYHLLSVKGERNSSFLKNAVIIIDPLVNPDGREKYVNWYKSTRGLNPNKDMNSIEHYEPWPGGRVNHYYFDLNRDWSWASQRETQERLKLYHKVKPHVYIDFHEMYYSSSYFFFPPTKPINPHMPANISDVYQLFADNNSKYLDEQGKTYYTKEFFDLFYPGYGDSYPALFGSLGMTYEQAGHSRGGILAERDDNSVLSLEERLYNHYTTSIASIETSVIHQSKIQGYFKNYFKNSFQKARKESFKYYIPEYNAAAYKELIDLLKFHDVKIHYSKKDQFIRTNKHKSYKLSKGQAIIPVQQNQFTLLKTLFSNSVKIPDTAFYDVSSWSLPLSFNVPLYTSGFKIDWTDQKIDRKISIPKTDYAYTFTANTFNSLRFLKELQNQNLKLMINLAEFTIKKTHVPVSSIIIAKFKNKDLDESKLFETAKTYAIQLNVIESGLTEKGIDLGSDRVKNLEEIKLAIFTGEIFSANDVGATWHAFDQFLNLSPSMLNIKYYSRYNLEKYNTIILPSSYSLSKYINDGNISKLRNWVRNGGHLIVLGQSIRFLSQDKTKLLSYKVKEDKDQDKKKKSYVPYKQRYNYYNKQSFPGAILEVKIDQSHPIAVGLQFPFYTLKTNRLSFETSSNEYSDIATFNSKSMYGFVPDSEKNRLNDSKFFSINKSGRGIISTYSSNPFFRMFQLGGLKLMMNDVFFGRAIH